MAAKPELAPSGKNRLLESTSVVTSIVYNTNQIRYHTFDSVSEEIIHLIKKPSEVKVGSVTIGEAAGEPGTGWNWKPFAGGGGVLEIRKRANEVTVVF
jgi:hypothetical protein